VIRLGILGIGVLLALVIVTQVSATTVRPVQYGPWGMICTDSCSIRYETDRHEVQWEAVLDTGSAQVHTWGRNKANCRQAQVSEGVGRNYRPGRPNRNVAEEEEFARAILQVMRSHSDFFGDCYNERGRTEPISPTILDEAASDFMKAFGVAESNLRAAAIQAEARQEAR
jgi:hypothetical protein